MIVTRLKLPLEQEEFSALLKVADKELRNPTDQARFILRQELARRGLLLIQADLSHVEVSPIPTNEKIKTN
jgi:hypothetical protein